MRASPVHAPTYFAFTDVIDGAISHWRHHSQQGHNGFCCAYQLLLHLAPPHEGLRAHRVTRALRSSTYRELVQRGLDVRADLGIILYCRIHTQLHTTVPGGDETAVTQSIGEVVRQLPAALTALRPDVVVVHGDR